MSRRYKVLYRKPGEINFWYVVDTSLPKSKGQVFAYTLSRRDAYHLAAALNNFERPTVRAKRPVQQRKVANCAQCSHCEYYHHPEKASIYDCFRKSATVA